MFVMQLIGLAFAVCCMAPVRAQHFFVINAAAAQDRRRALLTALIVAFCDVAFAFFCFFGAGKLMQEYEWLQTCFLCAGGAIVIKTGYGMLCGKGRETDGAGENSPLWKTAAAACALTWSDPRALIAGTETLGDFFTLPPAWSAALITLMAAFLILWFTGTAFAVSLFRGKISAKPLRVINAVCGTSVIFYGLELLLNGLAMFLLK